MHPGGDGGKHGGRPDPPAAGIGSGSEVVALPLISETGETAGPESVADERAW